MRHIAILILLATIGTLRIDARSVLNFPRLDFEQNTLVGIAIVNPTDQPALIVLTAYGNDGRVLSGSGFQNPAQITVPARQQASKLTSELFGTGLDPATLGWFQGTSNTDGLVGFFIFLNSSITLFDGADLPDSATRIVFNQVRVDAGYSTDIYVINTSGATATLELRLLGTGSFLPSRSLVIASKGIARVDPASLFGVQSLPPGAYMSVSSDNEVAGFQFVKSPNGDLLGLNARSAGEQLSRLDFPQMAVLGPWKTELGLLNYSVKSILVTITAYKSDGTLYRSPSARNNPVTRTLEAGASLREDLETMFGFSGAEALDGWVRAESSDPALNGYISYGIPALGSIAAVAGAVPTRTRAIFSHIATVFGYFTGVAVLNPGTVPAALRLLAIRPNGQVLGTFDAILQPGQRISKLIEELIPQAAGQAGGLIWVKSDLPVQLTSIFGTTNGVVLANIPAQPSPDSYQPDSVPAPDLSVTKSHSGDFSVGTNGVYTISVQNKGQAPTTGPITVTDSLPTGLSYVSGTGAGWTCTAAGQTVTCTSAGPIAKDAVSAIMLTVAVGPAAAPGVVNVATAATAGDPNSANDSGSDATVVAGSLDLSIVKSHLGNFTVGGNGSYTLAVQNVGSMSTTGTITVTDTLPTGLTFISATGAGWNCSTAGQLVSCANSTPLAPASTRTLILTVSVGASAAPGVTNTAAVSTPGDTNSANNSSSDPTTVTASANLSVTKSGPPNCSIGGVPGCDGVTYSITVANAGPSAAGGVTLTDTLPVDPPTGATVVTFVSATPSQGTCSAGSSAVTCSLGTLASGGSATVSLKVNVNSTALGRLITNNATVTSAAADSNPANNSAAASMNVFPSPPETDLEVTTLTASPNPVTLSSGSNVTYTATVVNKGRSTATQVKVTDTIPAGMTHISSNSTQGTCSFAAGTVTCDLGTLVKNSNKTITIVLKPSSIGSKTNTVAITSTSIANSTESDPVSSNNSKLATVTVNP